MPVGAYAPAGQSMKPEYTHERKDIIMYELAVKIKSGTGHHFDEGGCDMCVAVIKLPYIPRIGEIVSIIDTNEQPMIVYRYYLVREIQHIYKNEKENWITVYVIPI